MLSDTQRLVERATLWLLRNRRPPLSIEAIVRQFGEKIATLSGRMSALLPEAEYRACEASGTRLAAAGVPAQLAERVARLDLIYCALDIVEAADQAAMPVDAVGAVYFGLYHQLDLGWLRNAAISLPASGQWQARAKAALVDGVYQQARQLTTSALHANGEGVAQAQLLERWLEVNGDAVARVRATLDELRLVERPDLAMLSVALREVGALVRVD